MDEEVFESGNKIVMIIGYRARIDRYNAHPCLTVQVVEHELEELLGTVGLGVHLEDVRAERVTLETQNDELEELAELVGQHSHVVVVQHELLQLDAVADLGRQGAQLVVGEIEAPERVAGKQSYTMRHEIPEMP